VQKLIHSGNLSKIPEAGGVGKSLLFPVIAKSSSELAEIIPAIR
jgi:hypothetical protein